MIFPSTHILFIIMLTCTVATRGLPFVQLPARPSTPSENFMIGLGLSCVILLLVILLVLIGVSFVWCYSRRDKFRRAYVAFHGEASLPKDTIPIIVERNDGSESSISTVVSEST